MKKNAQSSSFISSSSASASSSSSRRLHRRLAPVSPRNSPCTASLAWTHRSTRRRSLSFAPRRRRYSPTRNQTPRHSSKTPTSDDPTEGTGRGWVDRWWVGGGPRGVVTRHVDGRCFLRRTRVCALCMRYVMYAWYVCGFVVLKTYWRWCEGYVCDGCDVIDVDGCDVALARRRVCIRRVVSR